MSPTGEAAEMQKKDSGSGILFIITPFC